jgi:UDP-3-O-[3-hydroxymyristoyl] glucosamine N-acyltransferase
MHINDNVTIITNIHIEQSMHINDNVTIITNIHIEQSMHINDNVTIITNIHIEQSMHINDNVTITYVKENRKIERKMLGIFMDTMIVFGYIYKFMQ